MDQELNRLRVENASLLTLVEQLEKEGAALAGRLASVGGEEARARGKEAQLNLQRQLAEAERRLQQALVVKREKTESADQNGKEKEQIELIQRELMKARLSEAENEATIRDLRTKIAELEQDKKTMHESTVDNSVAHLQEELIAVKLREAEATLSLKDLKQKVTDLSETWVKHLQEHRQENKNTQSSSGVLSTPKKIIRAWENRGVDTQRLEEDLMTTRIRETETLAELKDLRLKVMEMESQVQVSTNQLRRQDDEKKIMRDEIDAAQKRVKELLNKLKDNDQRFVDLETKSNYEQMLNNIKFAEDSQRIAALKHEISVLKMRNQITITEGKLKSNENKIEAVQELHDKVSDM